MHYIKTHYKGPRMVLAGAGGVDHNKLCELASKHFASIGTDYEHEIPLDQHCRYKRNYFLFWTLNFMEIIYWNRERGDNGLFITLVTKVL